MRLHNRDPPLQRPCAGWRFRLDGLSSSTLVQHRKQGITGAAERLVRRPRGIDYMPVYRANRESLLLQGDIPRCIRRITRALFDPCQPGREIRGEEQADEANAVSGCEMGDFRPFRFLQVNGIEHDRTALGEDTLRGAPKHAVDM